jgi:CheY-like chemotaxis protein
MALLANNAADSQPLANVRVSNRPKILVVDDSPLIITVIRSMLSSLYEVSGVNSGEEALQALSCSFFDLALLDIIMPGMTGIELLQKMRATPEYGSIPVIFITSVQNDSTIKKAIDLGVSDYIVKPFEDRTLQAKVYRALRAATDDQSVLFLERKVNTIISSCMTGDMNVAQTAVNEIPKDVYSKFVFLKLHRVLVSLHNRDFNQAKDVASEIIAGLRKRE